MLLREGRFCNSSANMTVDTLRVNSLVGGGPGVLTGLAFGEVVIA